MARKKAPPKFDDTVVAAGIDPSLVGFSICYMDANCNIIKFNPVYQDTGDRVDRLIYLATQVEMSIQRMDPDMVFLEGYAFAKGHQAHQLGEIGGQVRRLLRENRCLFQVVPPKTLKKYVTGKGNAKKEVMLHHTYKSWGVGDDVLVDNNQVDSYGLARMAMHTIFLEWKETKERCQIIDRLRAANAQES